MNQQGQGSVAAAQTTMTRQEAEHFLYHEARLLDDRRLREWFELVTEDIVYWVPVNDENADPARHLSMIWDKYAELEARVWRITESGLNHSQDPPSKTVRFVTNVEVEPAGREDEVLVFANVLLSEFRPGLQRRQMSVPHWYATRCQYRLRHVDGIWKIAYRKVALLDNDGILNAMTFFI